MPRCLSTLTDLPEEGYSSTALNRLANRRRINPQLGFTRAEFPGIRAEQARMSISGMQDKLSLRLHRGRLTPTVSGGQYILKPIPGATLPAFHDDVPANEHITMQLADQVFGIRTAANGLIRLADGELAYLTRRFDRTQDGQKRALEDFCQLMRRTPATHGDEYKYDSSYEALAQTLKQYAPAYAVEVEELFRRIVFSYAVGNGDAHLRNFSLLATDAGDHRLSPAYDLVSSSLHLPNESRLALDLFIEDEPVGVATAGFVTGRDLMVLAQRMKMLEARAAAIVAGPGLRRNAVVALIQRSFLSDAAKHAYIARFEDRLLALAR